MDLTSALVTIEVPGDHQPDFFNLPEFNPTVWTDSKLRSFLDSHGIKYQPTKKPKYDGGIQYDLSVCPKCGQSEGNPAVWRQDGVPQFKCFRAKAGCDQFTFADLQAFLHRPALNRVNAGELVEKYLRPRSVVIHRLIRHGDVVNVIGGPKARKSFLVMQLALCIASGTPFLGWKTVQGRVLLIDNELRGDDLAYRLTAMAKALDLHWEDVAGYIDIMPLRGKLADLTTIRDELCGLPPDTYSLVIIDALYKALPAGVDENSNSNITQMYVLLDQTAEKHNCAMTVVHHTSKGSQQGKSVSDMGSGAGAQSRSADVHIVLREHEDKDTVVLQAIVRSQQPIEPLCLTFAYPLWQAAPGKDPNNVAVSKRPAVTLDAFLNTLPLEPEPKLEVLAATKQALKVSRTELLALVAESTKRGLIEVTKPSNKKLPHTIRRIMQQEKAA